MGGPAILVAGHAVLRKFSDPTDEVNWVLLDFQRGEVPSYIEHVRHGVQLAAQEPQARLIFTGGQSREAGGPRSEALCYYWIAEVFGWFGHPEVAERAATEEFARDSFENLLFGVCRYREIAGEYPSEVWMVSWRFKEQRFHLHREAIRWPYERFRYEAPNNPPDLEQALAAERRAIEKYTADPYSSGEEFSAKRRERNPFRRQHGYFQSCPEAAALFEHAGPAPFAGAVPWDGA